MEQVSEDEYDSSAGQKDASKFDQMKEKFFEKLSDDSDLQDSPEEEEDYGGDKDFDQHTPEAVDPVPDFTEPQAKRNVEPAAKGMFAGAAAQQSVQVKQESLSKATRAETVKQTQMVQPAMSAQPPKAVSKTGPVAPKPS